jgi:hypothetical protein
MQQALDALEQNMQDERVGQWRQMDDAVMALRAELAKPEPEPIGFLWRWKAKEHEPADANPWQFRGVPVRHNIAMLDLIPLYRGEDA